MWKQTVMSFLSRMASLCVTAAAWSEVAAPAGARWGGVKGNVLFWAHPSGGSRRWMDRWPVAARHAPGNMCWYGSVHRAKQWRGKNSTHVERKTKIRQTGRITGTIKPQQPREVRNSAGVWHRMHLGKALSHVWPQNPVFELCPVRSNVHYCPEWIPIDDPVKTSTFHQLLGYSAPVWWFLCQHLKPHDSNRAVIEVQNVKWLCEDELERWDAAVIKDSISPVQSPAAPWGKTHGVPMFGGYSADVEVLAFLPSYQWLHTPVTTAQECVCFYCSSGNCSRCGSRVRKTSASYLWDLPFPLLTLTRCRTIWMVHRECFHVTDTWLLTVNTQSQFSPVNVKTPHTHSTICGVNRCVCFYL